MGREFTDQFEEKVKDCIEKYSLIGETEKVIVACSGGKDSTATLYILKKLGYNVEGLIIDLLIGEWSKKNLENVERFCKENGIKLHTVNMRKELGSSMCYIRSGIQETKKLSNCLICGVIKRWLMNRKARELGASKIATGHNLDDEAETIMMNLLTGNPELSLGLGPEIGMVRDKKLVQRVKPLYFCTNKEVRDYSEEMGFPVLYEPCPCSEGTFRRDVRKRIADMENNNPMVKQNIVNNFLAILPVLRKNYKTGKKLSYCKSCGEPSRRDICKKCELMEIMRV
jgi:uncharacterized protein (TIGR00269 family)